MTPLLLLKITTEKRNYQKGTRNKEAVDTSNSCEYTGNISDNQGDKFDMHSPHRCADQNIANQDEILP